MEKAKQRRLSSKVWRGLIARFEESGLTAIAFCEREGVSSKSFYRWRTRLSAAGQAATRTAARVASPAPEFIDLGALRGGSSRLELRLDLGGGVLLHLVRE
ncbi:MAG TPA: transposase [Steroidobacteraceae bacterium]